MKILTIIFLLFFPLSSFATGQQADILKYGGLDYHISIFPLEESSIRKSVPLTIPIPEDYKLPIQLTLHTNSSATVISTGNYRGYIATWEIKDSQLFLININGWIVDSHTKFVSCPTPENPNLGKTETTFTHRKATLELLFPDKVQDGRVHATWYSGELFTGGWHPGIKRSEKMLNEQKNRSPLVFLIENGIIKSVEDKDSNQSIEAIVTTPVD